MSDLPKDEVEAILQKVGDGLMTVRLAAELLGWTMDEVQEAIWGEILL